MWSHWEKRFSEKESSYWIWARRISANVFVGSYFGVVWMFIQPVVTVAIYAFVFGESGFRSAPPVPGASYVVWLVPGIVPWFFYSEALNAVNRYTYI